ncbi:MAG: ChbG/HpnK family deacetylase [Ruminococcaceae bacterium]|nr:ChbG/HpnK family deacetylase [Oscillospiraceae bacterium]
MIYFCADDYGLNEISSGNIQQCIDKGVLNKVSVFPNFDRVDLHKLHNNNSIRISLHLNLVEGKCMADAGEIDLLADKNGNLKHTFIGLLRLNLLHARKLETQVYKEIKAQVLFWKNILPEDVPFCIDSHQHTHMIPVVFKSLLKVLEDEKINLEYMRIPTESILPYVKTPSLYFSHSAVNIIKQWLLNFLWLLDKKRAEKYNIPTSYFFGILFSGRMDEKRISKILPKYVKMAEKHGKDIEVLFHPGYMNKSEIDFKDKNIAFKDFYLSDNRKTEFDSVIKISERSVP